MPETKKFLSKKERIAKKEEERKARQAQERESYQMGNALAIEVSEFKTKKNGAQRRKSAE